MIGVNHPGARLITPIELSIAPSVITPTVNANWLSVGPPLTNSAAAPANFPQTDIAEFPGLKLCGA